MHQIGTSSIVSPEPPFLPHLQLLSSIVETVVKLRELGHRVVLVSSGAIGVGLRRMGLKERGKGLSVKQVSRASAQIHSCMGIPEKALFEDVYPHLDSIATVSLLTCSII